MAAILGSAEKLANILEAERVLAAATDFAAIKEALGIVIAGLKYEAAEEDKTTESYL